ncbi:hypothetical protein [Streptomyces sp. NPDC093225]|uniref:hypothetical protein n=1 Tax=Streptomyces sp. NPDC093225 TaxID=3366034 RepID=UPI00381C7584
MRSTRTVLAGILCSVAAAVALTAGSTGQAAASELPAAPAVVNGLADEVPWTPPHPAPQGAEGANGTTATNGTDDEVPWTPPHPAPQGADSANGTTATNGTNGTDDEVPWTPPHPAPSGTDGDVAARP